MLRCCICFDLVNPLPHFGVEGVTYDCLLLWLQSYAESTIKEMLGWYGLQDQAVDGVTPPGDSKKNNGDLGSTLGGPVTNGWELGAGCPSSTETSRGELHLCHYRGTNPLILDSIDTMYYNVMTVHLLV